MPSTRFAICLFKKDVSTLDITKLLGGKKLKEVKIKGKHKNKMLLMEKKADLGTPAWVDIVEGFSEIDSTKLASGSSGAILFIQHGNRIVGCCFGTSIAYINRSNIVSNFGLGVVYQEITSSNTKSIESFSLNDNPITFNRASTNPTNRNNFELDNYTENITELAGFNYRNSKRILVKGKEFYSSPCPPSLKEIISISNKALNFYNKAAKDKAFQKLTSSKVLKDKTIIDVLDTELCSRIDKKSKTISIIDNEYLSDISGYKFTNAGDLFTDIEISELYDSIKTTSVTVNYLKSRRIIPFDKSSTPLTSWSLYKCLFVQADIGVDSFILFKGKWYEIDKTYLSGLRKYIKQAEINITTLKPWNQIDKEADVNISIAKQWKGQCWDKKLYVSKEYNYGIEFCDVLTKDQIIHVKKYDGSQLTSHLVNQTSVSAILFKSDKGIRKWINSKVDSDFKKKNIILKKDHSLKNENIKYLILFMYGKNKMPSQFLPFFSLVALQMTIRRIRELGYEVEVGKI